MDSDTIWRHVDEQRGQLADLLDTLKPEQWSTPSLCAGWTVRDVAVHVTQVNVSRGEYVRAAIRSGFRFDAMISRMAVTDTSDPATITARLRAIVGDRGGRPSPRRSTRSWMSWSTPRTSAYRSGSSIRCPSTPP